MKRTGCILRVRMKDNGKIINRRIYHAYGNEYRVKWGGTWIDICELFNTCFCTAEIIDD